MMGKGTFWAALALAALIVSPAEARVFNKTAKGNPEVKSIHVIGFAPDGVLLIGDGTGAQVLAVDTGDTEQQSTFTGKISKINALVAGKLGTTAENIEIVDLAVNPASGAVYLAVRKQDDKSDAILTVNGDGQIEEFVLENVTYARLPLQTETGRLNRLTDVAWADDRVIAAGASAEEFASKIFSIDAPLTHDQGSTTSSAETYHVSHRKWETKAPMSVVIPFKDGDKSYLIGAFACTPIVKYPLDEVKPGAKVKGSSILELGSGNRPIDMFTYEKDGKTYVLSNSFRFHHARSAVGPSPYWTVRFGQGLLEENEKVNDDAPVRTNPRDQGLDVTVVESFHGVMQMDKLDARRAVVLRDNDGSLDLEAISLP